MGTQLQTCVLNNCDICGCLAVSDILGLETNERYGATHSQKRLSYKYLNRKESNIFFRKKRVESIYFIWQITLINKNEFKIQSEILLIELLISLQITHTSSHDFIHLQQIGRYFITSCETTFLNSYIVPNTLKKLDILFN